jgi:hypothetical protein
MPSIASKYQRVSTGSDAGWSIEVSGAGAGAGVASGARRGGAAGGGNAGGVAGGDGRSFASPIAACASTMSPIQIRISPT